MHKQYLHLVSVNEEKLPLESEVKVADEIQALCLINLYFLLNSLGQAAICLTMADLV